MKRSELLFSGIAVPLDYLAFLAAALGAYFVRYLPLVQNIRPVAFDLSLTEYLPVALFAGVVQGIIFAITGLYAMGGTRRTSEEISRVFVGGLAGMAVVLAVMVFSRYLFDSRFIILVGWLLVFLFVSVERGMLRLIQRYFFHLGVGVHRAVIIGTGQSFSVLADEFKAQPTLGYRLVKHFPQFDQAAQAELEAMVHGDKCDEIIQINPNNSYEETSRIVDFVNEHHLSYQYAADLLGAQLTNLSVRTFAGIPLVEVKQTRLDGWGRIYKRLFDIICSVVLLVLFSPLMIVVAVLIKLDSAGPIFFRYKRIGGHGKEFTYFKFRSMIDGAHRKRFDAEFLARHENVRAGTPMIKFKDDPRVTRVGKFIRRWSIDELPELFLALLGSMSLVGPRPHEVEEVAHYEKHHKKALTLKPGITGLAQISGRSDLDFEQEVKLDTYYIENWSPSLDLTIMLRTPLAIIRRRKTD